MSHLLLITYRKTLKPHACAECNTTIPKSNHVATYNAYETSYGYRYSLRYTTRKYLCTTCTTNITKTPQQTIQI